MVDKVFVLLVDDDHPFTEELKRLFALDPTIKLMAVANSVSDAVERLKMLENVHVVLANLEMPDGDGTEVLVQAKKIRPQALTLGLTQEANPSLYQRAVSAGAKTVIVKSTTTTGEIVANIRDTWEQYGRQQNAPAQTQYPQPGGMAPYPTAYPPQQGFPQQHPGYGQPAQGQYPQQGGYPAPQGYPPQGGYPQAPVQQSGYAPEPYQGQPQTQPGAGYPGQAQGYPQGQYPQAPQGGYGSHEQYPQQYPAQPYPQYPQQMPDPYAGPVQSPLMAQPQMPTASAPRIRQTVVAINSPKGGVGKSTISKEMASALAMAEIPTGTGTKERLKVCLVDMDLDYGNIAQMLQLKPIPNISTWADNIKERLRTNGDRKFTYSPEEFMPYLLTHAATGLKVLAAPLLPTQAIDITETMVEIIIESLKNYFDVVIIDTGNNTKDYTLISLERASKVILVTTAEVPTIRNVQALLETLKAIHYPLEKLHLVINDVSKRNDLSISDIVDTLGIPFLGQIPEDPRVKHAANNGELLVMSKETEFTQNLKKITHQMVPVFNSKKRAKPAPVANGRPAPSVQKTPLAKKLGFGFLIKK